MYGVFIGFSSFIPWKWKIRARKMRKFHWTVTTLHFYVKKWTAFTHLYWTCWFICIFFCSFLSFKNWKTFFSFFTMKFTFTILNISCMYFITNSIYAFNFSFMLKNVDEKFCNFMRHNKSNEKEMNSLPNVLCIVHEKAFFISKQCLIDFLKWEILTEVFNFKVMRKKWDLKWFSHVWIRLIKCWKFFINLLRFWNSPD